MALPLNAYYGPTPGWTVQGGDGGDQNLVGNAGMAQMGAIAAPTASGASYSQTVAESNVTATDALITGLTNIGLMA